MADLRPNESPADGQRGPIQPDPPELALAHRALESGDYGACLRGLAPLADAHGASTAGVLMLVGLCVDFLADGDLDVLQLFC